MEAIDLIDGNSIAHANHNAMRLTVGNLETQAIFGFLKSLRYLLDDATERRRPIVLWDGSADFRKAIYPDYKGNRKALDAKAQARKDSFKRQTPLIEYALECLGVMQVRSPKKEADDLAAHMVNHVLVGRDVRLVSGDQDWIQLVRPGVKWFDPIRDRTVTHANLLETTGYQNVVAFVQAKAIIGDSSDNVPGINRLGEKTAQLLLAEHGSIPNLFARCDAGHAMKVSKVLGDLVAPAGRAIYERNMKLMDLSQAEKLQPGEAIIKRGALDPTKFAALCTRLHFASILRELPKFLRPFEQTAAAKAA